MVTDRRDRSWRASIFVLSLILGACGTGGGRPAGPQPLVSAEAWEALPAADDPLAEERPGDVACADGTGYYVEPFGTDSMLEVDTRSCNYLAVWQPSLAEVREGDTLELLLFWADLFSEPPAQAHIAVFLEGRAILEEEVGLPGSAEVRDVELTANFDAPAGAPVVFHLHNHDYNTWNFAGLSTSPPGR